MTVEDNKKNDEAAIKRVILPKATGYLPWLTPVAAVGLVLMMIGAILTHLRLQEAKAVGVPVVLMLLPLFIALGYFVFRVS